MSRRSGEVTVAQPPAAKTIEVRDVVPVEDMSALGESAIAPADGEPGR